MQDILSQSITSPDDDIDRIKVEEQVPSLLCVHNCVPGTQAGGKKDLYLTSVEGLLSAVWTDKDQKTFNTFHPMKKLPHHFTDIIPQAPASLLALTISISSSLTSSSTHFHGIPARFIPLTPLPERGLKLGI